MRRTESHFFMEEFSNALFALSIQRQKGYISIELNESISAVSFRENGKAPFEILSHGRLNRLKGSIMEEEK